MDATVNIYRQCFSTDVGKRVLANMLCEAKFFEHNETPEQQAVANFMKTVLCKCGSYDNNHVDEYVTKLMSMSLDYTKQGDKK
jgi:aerobic-type carbon monoxide dehydrogenase small subunit (CoxS/CutS family)